VLQTHGMGYLPVTATRYLRAQYDGSYFHAAGSDSYMLVDVPVSRRPLLVVTFLITVLP
jgi:hypothetical protein